MAANLVPLAGVLAFGWSAGELLALYWLENVVVGASTILKMAWTGKASALFFVPFFAFHYGLFTLVHGIVVYTLFVQPEGLALARLANDLRVPFLALVASHGVSFVVHFARGAERRAADPSKLFLAPYPRVVVMHVTVIGGAFLLAATGAPAAALAVLVALKTGVDVAAHLAERKRGRRGPNEVVAPPS